eukprot:TRINITY_DN5760_c0_g1_i1.p1 TRINITY_DN5760_c0_g1~~TRINITY_DN5760_c0_g1_i1.p1  ORF type:complete len:478 (+),score=92.40 TRINITY_DN5760_c0_g1_i1:779-2212(+)
MKGATKGQRVVRSFDKDDVGQIVAYGCDLLSADPGRSFVPVVLMDTYWVQFFLVTRSQTKRGDADIINSDVMALRADAGIATGMHALYSLLSCTAAALDYQTATADTALDVHFTSVLGRGASGCVYVAQRQGNTTEYVCKVFAAGLELQCANEVAVLKKLGGLVSVPVFESSTTLQLLTRPRGYPFAPHDLKTRQVVLEFADAVRSIHDRAVLHRDIRPENIIVVKTNVPGEYCKLRIIDYAYAIDLDRTDAKPSQGAVYDGTVRYASGSILQQIADANGSRAKIVHSFADDWQSVARTLFVWLHPGIAPYINAISNDKPADVKRFWNSHLADGPPWCEVLNAESQSLGRLASLPGRRSGISKRGVLTTGAQLPTAAAIAGGGVISVDSAVVLSQDNVVSADAVPLPAVRQTDSSVQDGLFSDTATDLPALTSDRQYQRLVLPATLSALSRVASVHVSNTAASVALEEEELHPFATE